MPCLLHREVIVLALALTLVTGLAPTSRASRSSTVKPAPAPDEPAPVALIETILVGGQPADKVSREQVLLIRASGEARRGRTGQALFANDEVRTGDATQATILFLDSPSEKDNKVILDSGSWIKLVTEDSVFLRVGRFFCGVQGFFSVVLRRYKLVVGGTEFEVTAANDSVESNRADVKVIDGYIDMEEGDFSSLSGSIQPSREPRLKSSEGILSQRAAFPFPMSFTGAPRSELAPVVTQRGSQPPTRIARLEEATLARGTLVNKQPSTSSSVRSVVDWTNDVIVARQPSYPAKRLIPHYASPEERIRRFKEARFEASLNATPGARKVLGDVYSDWGNGARAVEAYNKERANNRDRLEPANFLADLGEAYRLTGKLETADAILERALAIDPQSAVALNARGNLYLDRAGAAREEAGAAVLKQDQNKAVELIGTARGFLDRAKAEYERALSTSSPTSRRPPDALPGKVVIGSNIGEVYLGYGDVFQQTLRPQEARQEYERAEERFNGARATLSGDERRYPFITTGLGETYRRLARVEKSQANTARADDYLARAEDQNRQAIQKTPDLAEAYMNLGRVHEERGPQYWQSAKEDYRRAIALRPAEPAPRFRLGTLQQQEIRRGIPQSPDDDSLNDNLRLYLKLEPAAFRHGERALVAERVVLLPTSSSTVPDLVGRSQQAALQLISDSQMRAGTISYRTDRARDGTVIEQSVQSGRLVSPGTAIDLVIAGSPPRPRQVPNVIGDTKDHATSEITGRHLRVGKITERPECDRIGKVVDQYPPRNTELPEGATVDIVLGGTGENPARVPQVRGLRQTDAERAMVDQGLQIGRITREESEAPQDTVLTTRPAAGTLLPRECSVELILARPIPPVEVPNFIGMNERRALDQLGSGFFGGLAYLRRGKVSYQSNSDYPPGTVIDQSPRPGALVRRGTEVNLLVARGSDSVDTPDPSRRGDDVYVPRVEGMRVSDAEGTLERSGLRSERVGTGDYVGTQTPSAGTKVRRGAGVRLQLVFRRGPGDTDESLVSVPRVEGMKVSDAEGTLERSGLGYERAGNGDTVKTQSPTAGTRVRRGTSVRLSLVAANPDRTHPSEEDIVYIDIPNVTGISVREAKQRLKAAGLNFQVHGGDESGSVVKQDPPQGRTKVRRGTIVTVHLYRGVG